VKTIKSRDQFRKGVLPKNYRTTYLKPHCHFVSNEISTLKRVGKGFLRWFCTYVWKKDLNNFEAYPSLNNQSCIKGLLVVWDFCFWAVLVAGPVLNKRLGRLWSTFEGVFFMFSGANKKWFFFKHCSVRTKKLHSI
jgi:hypothetical protein